MIIYLEAIQVVKASKHLAKDLWQPCKLKGESVRDTFISSLNDTGPQKYNNGMLGVQSKIEFPWTTFQTSLRCIMRAHRTRVEC